ncbi:MAG: hypothetical protein PWP51_2405 [Clostridiales bacterium]|jgi:predicted ATPase/DNA-binding CsgD family transcriptional regulator|nr:hypothetical protein [Clostridiales bacterium]MDN5299852.1 hypothetical protein [Clostridiales bacterium]
MKQISSSDVKIQVIEHIQQYVLERPIEAELLMKHFDHILEGNGDVCFVSGDAGIGKTTFVENVVKSMVMSDVNCIYGKFRKHESKPFSAISEVVENMVKRLLTLPLAQLDSVRKTLIDTVGSDIAFIASLTPYLQKLLVNTPFEPNRAYVIQVNQVEKVLFDFMIAVSDYLFPMIIFIDDLQWGDRASLNVLEYFCQNYQKANCLLLITNRSYETAQLNLLEACFSDFSKHQIGIKPLSIHHIEMFLSAVLGKSIQNKKKLGRYLYGATLGNPFFIKEMLLAFIDKEWVLYDDEREGWSVNIEIIESGELLPDVRTLLVRKLEHLNADDWILLNTLACLDGIASDAFLMKIVGLEETEMRVKTHRLCENGLITIVDSDEVVENAELSIHMHDIIVDHIYRGLPRVKRAKIHTEITEHIIADRSKFDFNSGQLALTSQIMRADPKTLFKDPNVWVVELYQIGIAVKKITLIEDALKLFQMSETLLPCSRFKEDHLATKIQFELGECEFLLEKYEQADKRFQNLMRTCQSEEALIDVKCKYMDLLIHSGRSHEVIDMGRDVLKDLDFDLTTRDFVSETVRIKQLFSKDMIETLHRSPAIEDARILYTLNILTKLAPVSYVTDSKLFLFILLKIGEISAVNGRSDYAPIGYAGISFIQYNFWKDYHNGKRLMQIALDMLENTTAIWTKSIVHFLSGSFLKHRSAPIADTIADSMSSIDEGLLSGYYVYCGYSVTGLLNAKYVMGTPLTLLRKEIAQFKEKMTWMDRITLNYICETHELHIDCLLKDLSDADEEQAVINEPVPSRTKLLTKALFKLQRLYLEGNWSAAIHVTKQIEAADKLLNGTVLYPDILLYRVLTRAAVHADYPEDVQQQNLSTMKMLIDEFEEWNVHYAENHYARMCLAKAAYQKCLQPDARLDQWYNEAIESSERNGQIHMLALSNLLAARYHEKGHKRSNFYAQEAAHCFRKWGAKKIAERVRKEFLLEDVGIQQGEKQRFATPEKSAHAIRLTNEQVLVQLEQKDDEQSLIHLLNYLSQYSRAEYAAILLEKSDMMYLKYECKFDKAVMIHKVSVNINHVSHLSRKIIRYAARTDETFILSENRLSSIVAFDPYIMSFEAIDIVCVPIKHEGVLVGLCYFEKLKDDFDPNFIKQINMMVSLLMLKNMVKLNAAPTLLSQSKSKQLLTGREQEVLALLVAGLSNSEISQKLYITLGTVKNHLSNIYSKLGVDSRIQAVIKAKEIGVISD